nr:unnamed protein product [Spirometra erinaceieuropaei]
MFRTLYILLAIYILRGCPKIMPLVDQDPSDKSACTLNSTSIADSRKALHLMEKVFGGYDISPGVKLLRSTQSTDGIYTGFVPSAISARVRESIEKFKIAHRDSFKRVRLIIVRKKCAESSTSLSFPIPTPQPPSEPVGKLEWWMGAVAATVD